MKRNKTHALWLATAMVSCAAALASFAPVASAQPIPPPVPQTQQIIKTQFAVLRMSYQLIQVRSLVDMRDLHTFTYSPGIRDKMQNVFNAGGYQYGDKVVVWYQRGTNVALKIKGKPSKTK
jgi:hypothetical protein